MGDKVGPTLYLSTGLNVRIVSCWSAAVSSIGCAIPADLGASTVALFCRAISSTLHGHSAPYSGTVLSLCCLSSRSEQVATHAAGRETEDGKTGQVALFVVPGPSAGS